MGRRRGGGGLTSIEDVGHGRGATPAPPTPYGSSTELVYSPGTDRAGGARAIRGLRIRPIRPSGGAAPRRSTDPLPVALHGAASEVGLFRVRAVQRQGCSETELLNAQGSRGGTHRGHLTPTHQRLGWKWEGGGRI